LAKSIREGSWPLVVAHRGAAMRLPENTLAAFDEALALGADGVECDVRLSADGVPVVVHDTTVDRTTDGSGPVAALSLAELKLLDAGSGERVPTLAETIDLCRGRALLCLEFKTADSVRPSMELLKEAEGERVFLCSFLLAALRACAEARPDIPALLITGSRSINPFVRWREAHPIPSLRRLGAAGLSCHHRLLRPATVRRLKREGLKLVVWNSLKEEEEGSPTWYDRALGFCPDALVTARPESLLHRF